MMEKTTIPSTLSPSGARRIGKRVEDAPNVDNVTISYFENDIPAFVEQEMALLYENLFSSVAMVSAYGGTDGVSTYVARKSGRPTTIFLLRREQSKVVVLNEQISIDQEEIDRFARYLFARFTSVGIIFFSAIGVRLDGFAFPYQQARFTNDIVLALPASGEQYLAGLGKSTRQNLRYSHSRIKRDFPDINQCVYEQGTEGAQIFDDIVRLNRGRMSEKDKVCGVDEGEAQRLRTLAKGHGLVSVATIDGRVCAGAICYRIGANYFLRVIAHDSRYNTYGLGLLCCYLTICECIVRGGKEFHFMWGREEYKYRLQGKQRDFDSLAVYRSRVSFLLDGRKIVKTVVAGYGERIRFWLLEPRNQERAPARWARATLALVRKLKKVLQHGLRG